MPSRLAVTMTVLHAAEIAERQSPTCGLLSGSPAEGSFSSGHVADPLVPSAKQHGPGDRDSPWGRRVGALEEFPVEQEGLVCPSWCTPGHGAAVVTSLEKNSSRE
jgi:hypothetical protein